MIRSDKGGRGWPVVWVAGVAASTLSAGYLWYEAFGEGFTTVNVLQAMLATGLALICVMAVIMAFRKRLREP